MTENGHKPAALRKLERNAKGELVAYVDGGAEPITNVKLARCFPWSLGDEYISVCDRDGKEIMLLSTLEAVDAPTRAMIQEELRDKYFAPKIRRVTDYKAEFDRNQSLTVPRAARAKAMQEEFESLQMKRSRR